MAKTWQVGKKYAFVPSGDADSIIIEIARRADWDEGSRWFEETYRRPTWDQPFTPPVYQAVVLEGGFDADLYHKPGELYYVSHQEYSPEWELD